MNKGTLKKLKAELTQAFVQEIKRHVANAEERTAMRQRELVDQLAEVNDALSRQERRAAEYKALVEERDRQIITFEQRIETEAHDHQHEIQSLIKDHQHAVDKASAEAAATLSARDTKLTELQSQLERLQFDAKAQAEKDAATIEALRRDLAQAQVKLEALDSAEAERDAAEAALAEAKVTLARAHKEIEGKDRLLQQIEQVAVRSDTAAAKLEADLREQLKTNREELAALRASTPPPVNENARATTAKSRKNAKPATAKAENAPEEIERDKNTIDAFEGQTDAEKAAAKAAQKKALSKKR